MLLKSSRTGTGGEGGGKSDGFRDSANERMLACLGLDPEALDSSLVRPRHAV